VPPAAPGSSARGDAGVGGTGGQRPRTGSELGLIAQNLDPALWGVSLPSIFSSFGGAGFWIGVPQIALVNVVLSGDTAVVIALACRGLPPARRPWGIAVGAGTAALLLLTFAVIVALLLAYPYVKLIGGLALIYIAIKLLVQRSAREEAVAAATNLSAVVRIVLTADIILGLDNVIALAGIARGNFALARGRPRHLAADHPRGCGLLHEAARPLPVSRLGGRHPARMGRRQYYCE
jgi:YjbE family integral membrane protein